MADGCRGADEILIEKSEKLTIPVISINLLKRTIKGTYVSIEPFHLFRYLDEQSFRYNERKDDDQGRFLKVLNSIVGKRLTWNVLTCQEVW